MSQEDLARKAKLSYKTVNRFENGKHEGRRATIRQLADALGVDELDILGEPPNPLGLGLRSDVQEDANAVTARLARIEDRLDQLEISVDHQNDNLQQQTELLREIRNERAAVVRALERIESLVAGAPTPLELAAEAEAIAEAHAAKRARSGTPKRANRKKA